MFWLFFFFACYFSEIPESSFQLLSKNSILSLSDFKVIKKCHPFLHVIVLKFQNLYCHYNPLVYFCITIITYYSIFFSRYMVKHKSHLRFWIIWFLLFWKLGLRSMDIAWSTDWNPSFMNSSRTCKWRRPQSSLL